MLQQNRRSNPYPSTWEVPAGVAVGCLLVGALGVQVARGLANWSTGHGWTWPASKDVLTSIPGVLSGNAGAGLAGHTGWASSHVLTGWLIGVELVLVAAIVAGLVWGLRRWGPQRMKGMAGPAEAETTLGLTRLQKVRGIVRPDLYGPPRRTGQSTGAPK